MSLETFRKAIVLCEDYSQAPFIGGGEPTLHKHFEQILLEAMSANCDDQQVGIITNGSIKRRALVIAKLARAGVIYAQVSQDIYHDPISDEVLCAFHLLDALHGTGVRNTTQSHDPMPHGRAKELLGYDDPNEEPIERGEDDCPCPNWMVKPNGDIHQCGCEDSPIIGNVEDGIYVEECGNVCHMSQEYTNYIVDNE